MRVRYIGTGEAGEDETVTFHGQTFEKGKWMDVSKLAGFEKSQLNNNPTFEVQGGRLSHKELEKLHGKDEEPDPIAGEPDLLPPTLPGRLSSELPAGPLEEKAVSEGKPFGAMPMQAAAGATLPGARPPLDAPQAPAHKATPVEPKAGDKGKVKHK